MVASSLASSCKNGFLGFGFWWLAFPFEMKKLSFLSSLNSDNGSINLIPDISERAPGLLEVF